MDHEKHEKHEHKVHHESHQDQDSQAQEEHLITTHKKSKLGRNIAIVVLFLIIAICGSLMWLYTGQVTSAKEKVFNALPLPAAIVDSNFVSAKSIISRINLSKEIAASQEGGKADPDKTFKQIIDTKKIEALASKRNLTAPKEEIDEEYLNIIDQYANGDEKAFTDLLTKTYHMSADEFKSEMVSQDVLQSHLVWWYNQQEDLNKDAYAKAKDFQEKLANDQNFEELAKTYNDDPATKDFAGDTPMMPYDDLLPEFRESLKDSKVGDVKVLTSRFGLHVIKIIELNNDGENGSKQIHLQHILVKTSGFADWLKTESEKLRVLELLKFS
jgi:hypothetical protein